MRQNENNELRFLFYGGERPWKLFDGDEAPSKVVVELRSFPGDIAVLGASMQEAIEKLQKLLDAHIALAGSPREWYNSALDRAHRLCTDEGKSMRFAAQLFFKGARGETPFRSLKESPKYSVYLDDNACGSNDNPGLVGASA